jgi:hypothetical protein
MGFVYYRNHVHAYVMIHRDDCGHAQYGEGSHGVGDWSDTGEWTTGFATYEQARVGS